MRESLAALPCELAGHWRDNHAEDLGEDTLSWQVLAGGSHDLQVLATMAHERLSGFPGLHLTPLRRLHITMLAAGPAGDFSEGQRQEMLERAQGLLSGLPAVRIRTGRVLYHPGAIAVAVHPLASLTPVREAAVTATLAAGGPGAAPGSPELWLPRLTLCYCTASQPAESIISALGMELPAAEIAVDALSLVVQRGPRRCWDWDTVGTARLAGADHLTEDRAA
jgi:hypothetical protein